MCEQTAWLRHRRRLLRAAICFPAVIAITFFLFRSDGPRAQAGDGPNTRSVAAGGDLQQALDQAAPGDTIVLEAGAVFTGNYILRKKTGYGLITLISSASGSLPTDNRRVSLADAAYMPKLVTPSSNSCYIHCRSSLFARYLRSVSQDTCDAHIAECRNDNPHHRSVDEPDFQTSASFAALAH